MHESPAFLHRWIFHRLSFSNCLIFTWLCVILTYEKISWWNYLWIEAALLLKQLKHVSPFFSEFLKWILSNGVTATLFTEGVLPYQCVCCHWLHCLSGQKEKKRVIFLFAPKYDLQMQTHNFANKYKCLFNLDIIIVPFWCQLLCLKCVYNKIILYQWVHCCLHTELC